MTNLERAVALLTLHREARMWTDEAVARDMLGTFGVDQTGVFMTEAEVNANAALVKAMPVPASWRKAETADSEPPATTEAELVARFHGRANDAR